MPIESRQVVLASRPHGAPTLGNFTLVTAQLPEPGPGQIQLRVLWLSLDPYQRGLMNATPLYGNPISIGSVIVGDTVAEVTGSQHPDYKIGDTVLSQCGWQTHAIADGDSVRKLDRTTGPLSSALGVLGMPGFTAYSGLRAIAKPQPGETLAVAAASGAVGSVVGQLAQRAGATVIGIAGGPDKVAYVREELGFEHAIDYKSPDFAVHLAAAAPAGIDIYWENVGGMVSAAVWPLLNHAARIPVCGLIAHYDDTDTTHQDRLPQFLRQVLANGWLVQGFLQRQYIDLYYSQFLDEVGTLVRDGAITHREDIVPELENAPQAFLGLLKGRNFGKLIVRIAN